MTYQIKTKQHCPGCYRVFAEDEHFQMCAIFGQVKKAKTGREWYAEIRISRTGELIEYAGIWFTKRDAVAECTLRLKWELR